MGISLPPSPFAVHGNIVCTVSKEKAEELDIKLRKEERRADQIARREREREREREDLGGQPERYFA